MPTISAVGHAAVPAAPPRARGPEEAAEQFESILVRQFVQTMTKDLFKDGEGGAGGIQADAQRDALTDALTRQLTTTDALGLRDMLLTRLGGALADPGAHAALDTAGDMTPLPTRAPIPL